MSGSRLSFLSCILALVAISTAPHFVPWQPDASDRDAICAPATAQHPLGTDALGRDRLSRLAYGTRTSFLAASSAALATLGLGLGLTLIGRAAGLQHILASATDVMSSVPGFLLLIILRGSLPLSLEPILSLTATFSLLALLNWPQTARIAQGALESLQMKARRDLARAYGFTPLQVQVYVVLPDLLALAAAQFAVLLPLFILAEANLGMLGLGAVEPMASIGGLLRELVTASGNTAPLAWAPLGTTALLALVFRNSSRRLVHVDP